MIHELSKKMIDQRRKGGAMHNIWKYVSRPRSTPNHRKGAMFGSIENPIALEKERSIMVALQNNALLLLLLLGQESGTCGMFEHLANTLIGLC